MAKFSVKKPFTVLVAVVMVLVLGFVSITRMTTDLLPSMSLPYMMVITTYPGASPEKVESGVTEPMESGLGTITGVKNVYSVSNENYSLVELQFEDGTDMDSAMVKVSSAVQQVSAALPDSCGTPNIMEISMDMMATMYTAVSREDMDIYETSDYVRDDVIPYIERQDGVASVSSVGIVEKSVQVELNKEKVDDINAAILAKTNEKLADAKRELDNAKAKVESGKTELANQQAAFGGTFSGALFGKLTPEATAQAAEIKTDVDALSASLRTLQGAVQDSHLSETLGGLADSLDAISKLLTSQDPVEQAKGIYALGQMLETVSKALDAISQANLDGNLSASLVAAQGPLDKISGLLAGMPQLMDGLQTTYAQLTQAQLDAAVAFSTASAQLTMAESQLETAQKQFDTQKEEALKNANLDALLNVDTLSKMIYAQNFAMPAGYIDDENDDSWLLKVGDEFESADDISDTLLCQIDGIGDIRLSDVADITTIDNASDSYARLNGESAVVLCIYKASTAGTNEVSQNCASAFSQLEEKYPGTHVVKLMDQGDYITMIVNSVLSSMVLGAALAILVLAFFLKDLKPTLVVGVSIPLSVLFTIVLMYFTGLSLNMMTLSGLALGIGMLVDNSIVVMENIYRLRSRGVAAPRAAVQGTKQVTGAIVASTLTTVCVFLPMVFTTGTVRELLVPMALSIAYCLLASLVVAMTVVPATASTLLKNAKPKTHPWLDQIQEAYGASLDWCLHHKAVPLAATMALLALCVWQVLRMGIVVLPDMASNQIEVTITTPDTMTREESYQMADRVTDAVLGVDGVENIGVMDSASTTGLVSSVSAAGTGTYGSYECYVSAASDAGSTKIQAICDDILAATKDLDCTVTASAGGMADTTSLMASGLSVNVYGDDFDTLETVSGQVADLIDGIDGFENASNGIEEGAKTVHLSINRDKATQYGLTVAQIYGELSARLKTSATSTTITVGHVNMDVEIEDNTDPLTMENLMDMPFTCTIVNDDGTKTTEEHPLSDFATKEYTKSISGINRENQTRYLTVKADTAEGYNTTVLARALQQKLDDYAASGDLPAGYSVEIGGESEETNKMVTQMGGMLALGLIFIYLVMVAQFQSLLSPFIVLFTIPLAFTGGLLGLLAAGQQLSLLSLMGFVVLMGTVVNNGIVFVDYTNQLRIGGMERRPALIAAGKTRMRPIFMTALTTILAMAQLIFGDDMGSQLGSGMAIVIAAGLAYATITTLYIVPVMYDIFFKRAPLDVDVGSESLDDVPDDAAEFIAAAQKQEEQTQGEDTAQADEKTPGTADAAPQPRP
ncbi:MAG: efflux RND transporter permease subunit [Faecalibacterium sp.]|jgi:multidrug efflux pump subunit AcrB|nr:efflux RND transporter permease subunit [Faecalibacterium sp.]